MLHKIFAHISPKSPKSDSRSRLSTALLLTVTVLLGLSFSGVAYAKAANNPAATVFFAAKGHGQAKPSHTAPRKPLGVTKRQSQFKSQAHPNIGIGAEFVDFSYDPSYSPNFEDTIGIAVDYLGDVYVADIEAGTIYMETPIAGGGFTQSVVASGFEELYGITVDSNLNVYASDFAAGTVYIEVPNGGTYTQSVVDATLVGPTGLAVDPYGDVFVADTTTGLVEEVNNGGGSYTANNIYSGFFDSPNAIAIDGYGNLYVGDYIYQVGFSVLYSLPNYGGGTYGTPVYISDDFYGIDAISVANNGTLYVTDAGLFDYPAVYTMIPSQQGGYNQFQLTGTEVEYPFGGALDSLGNFYTTDEIGDFVLIISDNFGALPVGSSNGVNGPVQVNFAIDGAGTLGQVQVTTQGGGSLDFFNAGAASDSCSGAVFTSGGYCSVMLGFAPSVPGIRTGGVVLTDNTTPVGNFLASSEAFTGIGIAPRASFLPGTTSYVTGEYTYAKQAPNFAEAREKAHLKVPKISPHGAAKAMQISELGNYPGYEPDGIVVDPSGNYFVADQYYCAIYAYFPNSVYNLANPGATEWVTLPMDNSFLCPSGGLAVDGSGNVFFTAWYTTDNGAVVAYDLNLGFDATLGENIYSYPDPAVIYTNTGSGIPYYINNLAVDAYDNVYFTGSDDSYSDAYAYVAPSASYFYQYGFPPDYYAVSELPGTYDYLTGIAADDNGDVVISDYDLGEVFAYIPESNGTYYSYELARGLDTPVAVDIDSYENVYVLDSGDDTGISALYLAVSNGGVGYYQGGPTNGFNLIPLNLSYYWEYGDAYYFNFAIDSNNNFYLTDDGYWGGLITQIDVNDPPSLDFETTDIGLISVDSPQTVFLLDTGNDVLTLPVPSSGFNPSISTDFLLNTSYYGYFPGGEVPVFDCPLIASGGTSATISQDNACALPVSFAPLPPAGTDSGTLVVTSDSLYGSASVPLAKGATRMVKAHASVPLTKGGRLAKGVHPLATTAVSQTINLTGIGVDFFTIDFTVTGGGVPPIVKAGGSLAVQIVVAPVAPVTTFPLPVTLSAGGGPQGSSYTFVPSVIPAGAGSTTVTLTINIPIDYVAKNDAPAAPGQNHTKLPVAPLTLALLLLPMAGKLRKAGKRMSRMAALMLLAIAGITATATLIGCGANKAAVYEITVTGTSGILSHSTSFDITVEGR